jgi:uncharacterized protein YuzE
MSSLYLQITYRHGKPFAAYISFPHPPGTRSVRTEQVNPELVVDYAADGSPLGIEIVSPGHVSLAEINAVFDNLGISRPAASDLEPLRAA